MHFLSDINSQTILDSLGDGVYVTDLDRRIVYWNESAERITGWQAADLVGRLCFANRLAHIDKDGHRLCGEECCPLHRAIVTGTRSDGHLMFANRKDGLRIPLQATVAPVRNSAGEIIGGVEVFRDLTANFRDLEKAQAIQGKSLEHVLPQDPRISVSTHYVPHDIVGGDYYGIRQLSADKYGFFLADVMGHGLAAALYTMHLSALWDRYHPLLVTPSAFAMTISNELGHIVKDGEAFAAGICGLIDLGRQEVVIAGAGNPPPLLCHADGELEALECPGFPFGMLEDASYDDIRVRIHPGDHLLLFSDGATEVHNADDKQLGIDGLTAILKRLGYPDSNMQAAAIEKELLTYSNYARLEDDLTLIEIRFGDGSG